MTYRARAAALLLLLPMSGAAWAQVGPPVGGPAGTGGTAQGAACPPGTLAPGCRPPAARAAPAAPQGRQPNGVTGSGVAGTINLVPAGNGGHQAVQQPNQAQQLAEQRIAMGDLFGGRLIPPEILKILADPRIEPVTAYMVWQAARRPLDEWTVRQLQEITTMLPTLAETGMPMGEIQALYKYLELDPDDVFHPQFGQGWQDRSTAFDKSSAAAVEAISSADCQTDPGQMTVAMLRSCQTGGQ